MEEAASEIDCQETKLDKALEEIIEKEKAATGARSLQDDSKKTEKAAAEEHRTKRLSVWVKPRKGMLRNKTKKPRRQRKEEDLRRKWCNFWKKSQKERVCWERRIWSWDARKELSQKEDMMKMLAQQQQQQQTQLMLCLLAKGQNKNS